MNIGIIGTGERAGAIGRLLAKRHRISYSDPRRPEAARALAQATGNGAQALSPYRQVMVSDVLVLAVPWDEVDRALAAAGRVDRAIVVDATNADVPTRNGSSELIAHKLDGARVVKAFNTLPAPALLARAGQGYVLYCCGDDPHDKAVVAGLVRDAGFESVDIGRLQRGREMEPNGSKFNREIRAGQAA